ncbi:MAG: hypothetical protein RLZZ546_2009 [Bacteroidota bacterium]|jgi:outer membrane protein TolC
MSYKLFKILLSIFCSIIAFDVACQSNLTLNDAIVIGLSQSDNVKVSTLNSEIAQKQVYKANAGMLPRIDWNVNVGSSYNNVNQEFVDGRIINRFGRTIAPNTNLTLSWTLFDGGKMRSRYDLLQAQSDLEKRNTEIVKEELINTIADQYYSIARQKESIIFLKKNISFYEDRYRITKERWELGKGTKPDVLQSQNDLNIQKNSIEIAESSLRDLKAALNLTLNRDANIDFDVVELISEKKQYDSNNMLNQIMQKDDMIKFFDQQIAINQINETDLKGNTKPRINFSSALGYSLNNTNAGLILLNQNLGLNAAVNATWNLYDAGHNRKQIEINRLRTNVIEQQKAAYINGIKSKLHIALNRYELGNKLVEMSQENKSIAEENLSINIEKFKLGASTILEVNDAQQRFDNAANSFINAKFDLKLIELEIEKLLR